jgi:hypothetical protein
VTDAANTTTNLTGSAPGEDDVSGTITVPEIAHDTEEDEYVVRKTSPALSPSVLP